MCKMNPDNKITNCPRYEIRLMNDNEIDEVLNIWIEHGLYESKSTIRTFKQIDEYGFYVAVLEDGKVVACCAGVESHPESVSIGLYAVRKEYQGLGIGLKAFEAVMKHVGDKNAGLHPVEQYLDTYRNRAGFTLEDTYRLIVYENRDHISVDTLINIIPNIKIEPIREEYISAIVAFDEKIVKHSREKLLRLTFDEPETISRVAIDLDNGNILAYGCLRKSNANKALNGPIYSQNDEVSELLIFNLIKNFEPAKNGLTLMIPDLNFGARKIAEKLNLSEAYRMRRLFTKNIVKADMNKICCVHSADFYPF